MFMLIGIAILTITIFVHEMGHFLVMRRYGIPVTELVLGIGPTLYERRLSNGTAFRLKLPLLVGYNRFAKTGDGCLPEQPTARRLAVFMAGIAANLLVAVVTLTIAFNLVGFFPYQYVYAIERIPSALQPTAAAVMSAFGLAVKMPYEIAVSIASDPLHGLIKVATSLTEPVLTIWKFNRFIGDSSFVANLAALLSAIGLINAVAGGAQLLPLYPFDGGQALDALMMRVGVPNRFLWWWRRLAFMLAVAIFALSIGTAVFAAMTAVRVLSL